MWKKSNLNLDSLLAVSSLQIIGLICLFLFFIPTLVQAQTYNFVFRSNESSPVNVFSRTYFGSANEEPFNTLEATIPSGQTAAKKIKLKKGFSIDFQGEVNGKKTLIAKRSFESLRKGDNPVFLVVPQDMGEKPVLSFKDLFNQLLNDKVLGYVLDPTAYQVDRNLQLGTYILHHIPSDQIDLLPPLYWKNEALTKTLNRKDLTETYRIKSENQIDVDANVPLIARLNTSYGRSSLMDVRWDVKNLRLEQWHAQDQSYYDILLDNRNRNFYNLISEKLSVAPDEYRLYFVTAIEKAESIDISTLQYRTLDASVSTGFQFPAVGTVVAAGGKGLFEQDQTFNKADSYNDVYIKFLVQDLTLFFKTQIRISEQERNLAQVRSRSEKLSAEVLEKYNYLRDNNPALTNTSSVSMIQTLARSLGERSYLELPKDTSGNVIAAKAAEVNIENEKLRIYNNILQDLKDDLVALKSTTDELEIIQNNRNNDQRLFAIKESEENIELNRKSLNAFRQKQ